MDRSAVIVVGPPRSGTSVVCHVLQKAGVDFGDPALFIDPDSNKHNPIFFELVSLNGINEEILANLGWDYRDFVATPLEEDFTALLADTFEPRIADFIETNFGDSYVIGLKDPRFCFTLPVWLTVLGRLGISTEIVLTRRDAEAVAASNFRLSPERGIEYSRRIVSLSEGAAGHFLAGRKHHEVDVGNLAGSGQQAISALATVSGADIASVAHVVSETFDSSLMHSAGGGAPTASQEDGRDYAELARLVRRFHLPVRREGAGRAAGSAAGLTCGLALHPMFSLEKDLSFARGKVQLYFRSATESYAEVDSIVLPWPSRGTVETVEFQLPAGRVVEFMRLDLNDFPGAYAVQHLIVSGNDLAPLQHVVAGNGAVIELSSQAVGLVANHDDPWLEFKVTPGESLHVSVTIERLPMAVAGRRMFEDVDLVAVMGQLRERVSRLDDRIVHLDDRTASAFASGLDAAVLELRANVEEKSQQIAGSLEDARATVETEMTKSSADTMEGFRKQSERDQEILAALELLKARILKRSWFGWFK